MEWNGRKVEVGELLSCLATMIRHKRTNGYIADVEYADKNKLTYFDSDLDNRITWEVTKEVLTEVINQQKNGGQ